MQLGGKRRQPRTAQRDVIPVVAPTVFRFTRRTKLDQLIFERSCLSGDVVTGLRKIAIRGEAKTESLGVAARGDFQGLTKSQPGEAFAGLDKKNRGQGFPGPGPAEIARVEQVKGLISRELSGFDPRAQCFNRLSQAGGFA